MNLEKITSGEVKKYLQKELTLAFRKANDKFNVLKVTGFDGTVEDLSKVLYEIDFNKYDTEAIKESIKAMGGLKERPA